MASLVALFMLASGVLLPGEHVHYAPHGDRAAVVHRHLPHAVSSSTAIHGPEDDDHAQELRQFWIPGRPFVLSGIAAVAVSLWDGLPNVARREPARVAALRIDHGPPLPLRVLRGPPVSS